MIYDLQNAIGDLYSERIDQVTTLLKIPYVRLEPRYYNNTLQFTLKDTEDTRIASFCLAYLYGDDSVIVSHYSFVEPMFRHYGLGKFLAKLRMDGSQKVGARVILATVNDKNVVERTILTTLGWVPILELHEQGHLLPSTMFAYKFPALP